MILSDDRVRSLGVAALASLGLFAWSQCSSSVPSSTLPTTQPNPPPSGYSTVVSNLRDAGSGTLRAAILAANAHAADGAAKITFSVPGTIVLASGLPTVHADVTIDGTSAPGYARKGPVVEIDANDRAALTFGSGSQGSQLLAIAVDNASGNGVTLDAGSIRLNLDRIGVDLSGAASGNRGDGVFVTAGSSNDTIGANPSNDSGVVGNLISANDGNGISLHGSSNDTIAANRIGTDAAGTTAMPNGRNGLWITSGSDDNEVGGTVYIDAATGKANNPTGNKGTVTPVFVVPPLGNLISGNGANGVLIDAHSQRNALNGNFIGTSANGDAAIGNRLDGVLLSHAGDTTLTGCTFSNNPFVYYNVISGNGANGLEVSDSDDVTVQGNFFGVGANNTTLVANGGDGLLVDGTSHDTMFGGVIPLGNVAAGNARNGIELTGSVSGFTTFNTFGGLLAFKGAAPNGNDGLLITATGGNQTVRTNVFSGNRANGIEIGGNASGVTIDPNIAGMNTVGNAALPNGGDGLLIDGTAHGIVVGGYLHSVIPQNTFSGNAGYGIAIVGQAHDIDVFNTAVGTNVPELAAFANELGGIDIGGTSHNDLLGGPGGTRSRPRKSLISGNAGNGVTLEAGTSYIQVIDNWIGLDRFGRKTLPNRGLPILVSPASLHDTIAGNVTT